MPSALTREMTVSAGGKTDIRPRPVAATQTIKLGDILIASDSNGRVTQAASAGNNVAAAAANVRLAIAAQDAASLAADTEIAVQFVGNGNKMLRMPLLNDDTPLAWSNAYLNKQYEIRRVTTTGEYGVNTNATTNVKVEVVGVDESTASDTYCYVWVRPLENASWAR